VCDGARSSPARENSPYRGSVLSIDRRDRKSDDLAVLFHDLEPVDRNEIILPEQVLETLERNVLGYLEHAGALRQAGHGTRHGVLLHGPPGTGKTLVTRYLAQVARGATVILITGRQYAHLRSALQLARLLAPSLVILEDVDLIAMERRQNRHAPLLHELMDEMDGMGSASDCIFILTTNRPGVLEPALSARPGRVDQAIAFPLPDAARRRQLCEQFGRELHLDGVNQEALIARTEGASPAFLKELFRRATLLALERGHMEPPVLVQEQDFQQALRELVEFGGDLTRQFLGFPVDSPRAQALR
jgi:ATP-dependent 26S proteasome regulatory subunit